ncbi:hypothetical protein AX15_004928 [Amanita polypyramis BW_CC]|nr:hypothetical protein AX15_004928 [Amanita polypyramis BW_CC]
MPKSPSSGGNRSSLYSSLSVDSGWLRRCLEWKRDVEQVTFSVEEGEVPSMVETGQENIETSTDKTHINPKVAGAIDNMKTLEEAQNFLDVAEDIRAERVAELAVLVQQLEQCKREIGMLESKVTAARGRIADAERGIVAMRQLMAEKGILGES